MHTSMWANMEEFISEVPETVGKWYAYSHLIFPFPTTSETISLVLQRLTLIRKDSAYLANAGAVSRPPALYFCFAENLRNPLAIMIHVVGQGSVNGWAYSESTLPCLAIYKSIKSLQRALQSILQPPRRKMDRRLFSASFQLLFLLMVLVPSTVPTEDNGCRCSRIGSSISPRNIHSAYLIQPGPHCSDLEVITTMKDGSEVCLDPKVPWVQRFIQILLNRENS